MITPWEQGLPPRGQGVGIHWAEVGGTKVDPRFLVSGAGTVALSLASDYSLILVSRGFIHTFILMAHNCYSENIW